MNIFPVRTLYFWKAVTKQHNEDPVINRAECWISDYF